MAIRNHLSKITIRITKTLTVVFVTALLVVTGGPSAKSQGVSTPSDTLQFNQ